MTKEVQDLIAASIRLPQDMNGNPRYYVPVYMFTDKDGKRFRPNYAKKYRGKQFGPGWVFQSYELNHDLFHAINNFI